MNAPEKVGELSHSRHESTRGVRDARLRLSEVFVSRQGEGLLTGTSSYFVRLSGCNLRCWFCDTPYASWRPEGPRVPMTKIVDDALAAGPRHVVLTGGEPLIFPAVVELCAALRQAGLHVTIETAGTIAPPVIADLMSISPKLPSSTPTRLRIATQPHLADVTAGELARWQRNHAQKRWNPQAICDLIANGKDYQLKFVVDTDDDAQAVTEAVDELQVPATKVWIMPQAVTAAELDRQAAWLEPWCRNRGFHYCDRMQIRWYGNRRGT